MSAILIYILHFCFELYATRSDDCVHSCFDHKRVRTRQTDLDSLYNILRRMLCKESINLCGECALFCRQNSCGSINDLKIRFLDSTPSTNMFLAINLKVLTKKNAMEVVQMEINCGSNLVLVVVVKTQKGPKQKKFSVLSHKVHYEILCFNTCVVCICCTGNL